MKNVYVFIAVLLLIAGFSMPVTAQPQFYNYSGSGNGSNSFPFNVSGGKDVQLLYLAGEFNQPSPAPSGNITTVYVWMNSGFGPATYTDFTIKLGQSTITNLTPGSFYSGPMTTVYYRSSVSLSASSGDWLSFTLDTPFAYDPTKSLILDIGQCGASGTLGGKCAYTTLSGDRRVWSVGGCPFTCYNSSSVYVYNVGLDVAPGTPDVVTMAATGVGMATATMNGSVNANNNTTTVTFEYGLTSAYGTTVPGVPATVTGNSVTPVSAALNGLLPNTTYHYRVNGTYASGTVHGNDTSFTTTAGPPVVTTLTATSITSTSATLHGTVNATGATTTVTFEYGTTTSYGTTVNGISPSVTGNIDTPDSALITGLTPNTTYHYRIVGTNSVNTDYGDDMTFFASDCPLPVTPGAIAGPDTACGNSTGNVYSVPPITNATSYVWAVPAGSVITAGGGTNSITVTVGNTAGDVTVYGVDSCGNGPIATLPVMIVPAPVPAISGPDSMCVNSGYYNYTTEEGMSNYTWTVSAGGTITYGQGTHQIQVMWISAGSQSVSVNYMGPTGCFAGTPSVLPVSVTGYPGAAGTITGTASVCSGAAGIAYSVAPIVNAVTYVWTLPAGATIASGEFTNAITVDFAADASSGNITVYGNSLCGNGTSSPPFAVTVNPLPADAGTITGPGAVCVGDSGVAYTVPAVANATGYTWTVPTGAIISGGANTNAITVDFGPAAVSGVITVTGTNTCGNGTVSPEFPVTVNPVPATPVISLVGDTLVSDAPAGNQWYYEGTEIPGATGQTYLPAKSGNYYCIVTLNGCSSPASNVINVIMTGMHDPGMEASVSLFPNPGNGLFTLKICTGKPEIFTVRVFNDLGVMITEAIVLEVNGTIEKSLDLRSAANGVYTITILNGHSSMVKKAVISK
ncbi:MAG TPA: T9SS type A sorting domain-containing protein [Bacteroidales bacterium]|nr:T9SS type A sorting domain-containing protein [Bacteroidales bacterium]